MPAITMEELVRPNEVVGLNHYVETVYDQDTGVYTS